MYPEWLAGMFGHNPCTECRSALSLADIESVGIRRPDHAAWPYPLGMVVCVCRRCGNRMQCMMDVPLEAVLAAVEALYREVADAAPPKTGTLQITPPLAPGDVSPVRPSVREGQPEGPPTDEEVNSFLNRLRRMSFKTGSEGLEHLRGADGRTDNGHPADDESDPHHD